MSKAVAYILTVTAIFIFFIILSPILNLEESKGRLNRRILERAPIFDPLVSTIEREAEKILTQQQQQEKQVEAEANSPRVSVLGLNSTTLVSEVAETYQYLTLGGKLNTTLRLIILFPLLDREPKDGVVSFNELEAWNSQRAMERLNYATQVELETKDKDGDLALSFNEYLEQRGMWLGDAKWWMERFNTADLDHNGLLNFTELRDAMHPEDSKNQEMLKWVVKDKLKRMDEEYDGKLTLSKFKDHLYSTYGDYMEFEANGQIVPNAKDKFSELDVNKDQFLSPEELIPILRYIYPGELAYAKYFTWYLMNEADDNEDKTLSLQEMLNHEYFFYSIIHANIRVDSDDDHDEL